MFTVKQVIKAINEVSNTKARGKDGIPMYMIKGCKEVLATPLAIIFNKAFNEGVYPKAWKESIIVPTYKGKGDKCNINNYRPVAVTNTFSKVFEHLLRGVLVDETSEKMSWRQHGYLSGKSMTSNLLELGRHIYGAMEEGAQVDVVFTDLSCAFDMVCHTRLESKLKDLGVSEKLVNMIKSFVVDRKCSVQVGGELSESYVRTKGVPQGSPLGGQLFILFINSIASICRDVEMEIFADDVKIYKLIRTERDQGVLQGAINEFVKWIQCNGLRVNEAKCSVVSFGRKKKVAEKVYLINGMQVERLNEVKDLGVILDETFEFEAQRASVVMRARRLVGYILRNTRYFKKWENIVKIFCVIVRPILEYAVTIWSPYCKKEIKMVESVQSSFLRAVFLRHFKWMVVRDGYDSIYYSSEGLRNFFKIESLEVRRKRAILCCFKKAVVEGEGGERVRSELKWKEGGRDLRQRRMFEELRGRKKRVS